MSMQSEHAWVAAHGMHFRRTQAALDSAKRIVRAHGRVSGDDVLVLREAGFSDDEIGQFIATVTRGCRRDRVGES